jgi:hypothetical protein
VGLPAGIHASVVDSLVGSFAATAIPQDGDALISWIYKAKPARAIAPQTQSRLPQQTRFGAAALTPLNKNAGEFRLNLSTGSVDRISALDPALVDRMMMLASPSAGPLVQDHRASVVSPNKQFTLSSERTGSDADLNRYTLTIYNSTSGATIASFKSAFAFVPFAVEGSRVIVETGPVKYRTEKGMNMAPRRVSSIDTETGRELWRVDVRDNVYRGPFPP